MEIYQSADHFAYVKPNRTEVINLGASDLEKIHKYEIPDGFKKSNVFIQIKSSEKSFQLTYFSTSLKVTVLENYGQVKVVDANGQPLAKVQIE